MVALLFGIWGAYGAPIAFEQTSRLLQPGADASPTNNTLAKPENLPADPYDDLESSARDYRPEDWPTDAEPSWMTATVNGQGVNATVLYLGDSDIERWPVSFVGGTSSKDGSAGCTCADVRKRYKPAFHDWTVLVCGENSMLQHWLNVHPGAEEDHPLGSNGGYWSGYNKDVDEDSASDDDSTSAQGGEGSKGDAAEPAANDDVYTNHTRAGQASRVQAASMLKPRGIHELAQTQQSNLSSVDLAYNEFLLTLDPVLKTGGRVLYIGTKPEIAMPPDLKTDFLEYDARIREYAQSLYHPKPTSAVSLYAAGNAPSASAPSAPGPSAPTPTSGTPAPPKNASLPPLVVIDLHGSFLDMENPRELYGPDGMHVSDYGYTFLTKWTEQAMSDTVMPPCVIWKSGECMLRM